MTGANVDADVDADLAVAFLTPAAPERPELAQAIMDRVRRGDRRRRAVILASGLVGGGIAAAAVAATGLLDRDALAEAADLAGREATAMGLGLALIAFAAVRHALRDA